jgi:ABC-type proline/glycine betaine transport system permease subunit
MFGLFIPIIGIGCQLHCWFLFIYGLLPVIPHLTTYTGLNEVDLCARCRQRRWATPKQVFFSRKDWPLGFSGVLGGFAPW